jgi:hypothetical protein
MNIINKLLAPFVGKKSSKDTASSSADSPRRPAGRSRLPLATRGTTDIGEASILVDETFKAERERRLAEQQGHRKFGRVNEREHHEPLENQAGHEYAPENDLMQNPWLQSQRFDGIDPSLNPEPPLNSEARREYDNQKREQEMEKQLRLGLMPTFNSAPKPKGPQ